MKTTIETRFDIGQEVYVGVYGYLKVWSGKVHMIRMEWSPYGVATHYDIIIPYDKDIDDNYLGGIPEDKVFTTYEEAFENWKTK